MQESNLKNVFLVAAPAVRIFSECLAHPNRTGTCLQPQNRVIAEADLSTSNATAAKDPWTVLLLRVRKVKCYWLTIGRNDAQTKPVFSVNCISAVFIFDMNLGCMSILVTISISPRNLSRLSSGKDESRISKASPYFRLPAIKKAKNL